MSGGSTRMPGVVVAEPELAGRADHAVGDVAVGLPGGDREPAGQHGPGQRDRDQVADGEVARAADDAARARLADVDLAAADRLLAAGELLDVEHPADDDGPTRSAPTSSTCSTSRPSRTSAAAMLAARQRRRQRDVLAQPGQRERAVRPPCRTAG